MYSFIELEVKAIMFNIKVFVTHSDRALRNPPCFNDVTCLKMASGVERRSSRLLGKAQYWHKAYQAWCAMEFLLISFKTDKETFARCLSFSGHGNSFRSGKLIPPVWYPTGLNRLGYLITLQLIVVLGAFYHRRVLWHPISLLKVDCPISNFGPFPPQKLIYCCL